MLVVLELNTPFNINSLFQRLFFSLCLTSTNPFLQLYHHSLSTSLSSSLAMNLLSLYSDHFSPFLFFLNVRLPPHVFSCGQEKPFDLDDERFSLLVNQRRWLI